MYTKTQVFKTLQLFFSEIVSIVYYNNIHQIKILREYMSKFSEICVLYYNECLFLIVSVIIYTY